MENPPILVPRNGLPMRPKAFFFSVGAVSSPPENLPFLRRGGTLGRPKAFPFSVGAAPCGRPKAFPLGGRCPSAHTGADEGAGFGFVRFPQGEFRRHLRAKSCRWRGGCAPKRACGRSAGGDLLCPWRQSRQNATGDASDGLRLRFAPPRPIGCFPRTPFYGGRQLGDLGSQRKGAGGSADRFPFYYRCR